MILLSKNGFFLVRREHILYLTGKGLSWEIKSAGLKTLPIHFTSRNLMINCQHFSSVQIRLFYLTAPSAIYYGSYTHLFFGGLVQLLGLLPACNPIILTVFKFPSAVTMAPIVRSGLQRWFITMFFKNARVQFPNLFLIVVVQILSSGYCPCG